MMLGLNKSIQTLAPFLSVCAAVQFMLGACSETTDTHADSALPTLTEAVEDTIIVRSTQRDDLGSVETEIVDTADDHALAVAWHYPSDNRYDYATPLDDTGRAHIRSIPLGDRRSLAEYNKMLVDRYNARAGLAVEPYEQPAEYRRGCVLPFAHEHVACDDHCANECCTSLQQCLWEVEHTGDFGGFRAALCMHTAAMCHGTCAVCMTVGDFAAVNGGDCNTPALPGGKGEGLTCELGDIAAVKLCTAAWQTSTKLTRSGSVLEFFSDLKKATELVDVTQFPGSKCGCDMHPCFDSHCADRLLGDLAPGLTGAQVKARVDAVLDDSHYCARDCQLDGPDGFHACKCPSDQEWCTEGSRTCKDGLPAWDEYGDVARCQVSCDDERDSACWCRDRDAVLCLASVDCPTMGDACVHDQNGDGLHDHKDCEVWRDSNCLECGNAGDKCCAGNKCWHGGSVCMNGICEPEDCGTANNPCCSDGCDDTTSGGHELACISGMCRVCGDYGEPCCGSTCNWADLTCRNEDADRMYEKLCEPNKCAGMGEACCVTGTSDGNEYSCLGDARRLDGPQKGQLGYKMCDAYQDNISNHECIACGLEGEACCRDSDSDSSWGSCKTGLGCVMNTSETVVSRGNNRGDIKPFTICRKDAPPTPPTPTARPNLIVQSVTGDWNIVDIVIKNSGNASAEATWVRGNPYDGCMGIPEGWSESLAVPSLSAGSSTTVRAAYQTAVQCTACVRMDLVIDPVMNESDTDNRFTTNCSGGPVFKCSSLSNNNCQP